MTQLSMATRARWWFGRSCLRPHRERHQGGDGRTRGAWGGGVLLLRSVDSEYELASKAIRDRDEPGPTRRNRNKLTQKCR